MMIEVDMNDDEVWMRHTSWWPPTSPPTTRHFQQNCKAARAAAAKNGIPRLRPHVKTHKTIEGCIIQAGIDSAGEESLADVIGFVASTLPDLSMVVKLGCQYKRKPFTDVISAFPFANPSYSQFNQCYTS
eukprot:scaffold1709_cov74-Skeletonema_dohrnii-CCMP3373.AAC.6